MIVELNIFNLQRQPVIFDEIDSINWLDVYASVDSWADALIENDICDEIDSFSLMLLTLLLWLHMLLTIDYS